MQQYCELPTKKGIMRGFMHIPAIDHFPMVIMFHGFTGDANGDKFSYVKMARELEKNGIGTIRMDFLGSGNSDLSFVDMTFDDELSCARIILEQIKSIPQVTEIYVLGHSMGGCIASELAKIYPQDIKKMVLWAPAFNLPEATKYLNNNETGKDSYDHDGFEISEAFMSDITSRNFYLGLDIYPNELIIIHGTNDTTVPFKISENYLALFLKPEFHPIEGATHTFNQINHLNEVMDLSIEFLMRQ